MDKLNTAIRLYVGKGVQPFPKEDENRVIENMGEDGHAMVVEVKSLLKELSDVKPDWENYNLLNGSKWAVEQLRLNHPEINDGGAEALVWTYSWWWK